MKAIVRGFLFLALMTGMSTAAVFAGEGRPFEGLKKIKCARGIERYLPGDYHFCMANAALQRGKPKTALKHFRRSASWADKRAMFNLGVILFRGESVAMDQPVGLAWLALAAERKRDEAYRQTFISAYGMASPLVREEADIVWRQLKREYADDVVLARADKVYDREVFRLKRSVRVDPMDQMYVYGLPGISSTKTLLEYLERISAESLGRLPKGKVDVGGILSTSDDVEREQSDSGTP
ncbi:MAG: hypothetical protein R3F22_02520 [Lysobacteraceae bacterium]